MNEFCQNAGDVNVGRIPCDVKMGTPVGLLFGYGLTALEAKDGQDLASMLAKTQADDARARLYPYVMQFASVADESTDPTIDTQASTGYTDKLSDGSVQWAVGFPNTVCLGKQLVKLGRAGFTHVFVIANGYVWGVPSADGATLSGFPIASYYVVGASITTDTAKFAMLHLNLGYIDEFVANRAAITLDYSPSLIAGLTGYRLSLAGAASATSMPVRLLDPCTGNPAADLADAIATPAAWVVSDPAGGEAVTVSAVSFEEATSTYTLTLSGGTGAQRIVRLANPSVLEPLGASGVTGDTLTVTMDKA